VLDEMAGVAEAAMGFKMCRDAADAFLVAHTFSIRFKSFFSFLDA
jgi:hypothetical protein